MDCADSFSLYILIEFGSNLRVMHTEQAPIVTTYKFVHIDQITKICLEIVRTNNIFKINTFGVPMMLYTRFRYFFSIHDIELTMDMNGIPEERIVPFNDYLAIYRFDSNPALLDKEMFVLDLIINLIEDEADIREENVVTDFRKYTYDDFPSMSWIHFPFSDDSSSNEFICDYVEFIQWTIIDSGHS